METTTTTRVANSIIDPSWMALNAGKLLTPAKKKEIARAQKQALHEEKQRIAKEKREQRKQNPPKPRARRKKPSDDWEYDEMCRL
jgi:hypothetical protein